VTTLWGHELGLQVYRGEADDVLGRFTAVIRERDPQWIVRVTADNPFNDGAAIDVLAKARQDEARQGFDLMQIGYEPGGADGTSEPVREALRPLPGSDVTGLVVEEIPGTGHPLGIREPEKPPAPPVMPPGLPLGYGVQLARAAAVLEAERSIPTDQPWHRIHVLSWLEAQGRSCCVPPPTGWPDRPDWRWTVDTEDDLTMARTAFRIFGLQASSIGYPEMVRLLDMHPEVTALNQHVVQKAVEED